MMGCQHSYQSIGKFYTRRHWPVGGELFTVFRYRKCERCDKLDKKTVLKKRITASPDIFERQLRFSGIKPKNQIN